MVYEKEYLKNIRFPLGGIGSGSISLCGNGELCDFEIFNRPNKNTKNGYSHFAIRAEASGKTYTKVLQGDTVSNLMGESMQSEFKGYGFGPQVGTMAGFPHFSEVRFEGRFPIAELDLADGDFPGKVRLTAFNPFIPHKELESSLPLGFFIWEIENTGKEDIEYSIALSLCNPSEKSVNLAFEKAGVRGIFMKDGEKSPEEIGYTDISIATDCPRGACQEYWYRGGWQDNATVFWNNFSSGEMRPRRYEDIGSCDHGTVSGSVKIPSGEKRTVRFVIAWNTPVQYNYWEPCRDGEGRDVTWLNYYRTVFENSESSAVFGLQRLDALYEETLKFTNALHGSTMPKAAVDAVASNLSVLKSPTVLRLEDGDFWAWEGVHERAGSCEGSCQHVWNYAYAMPFLFPRLERTLRETTMKYGLADSGETAFRIPLPRGREYKKFRPCVDGQFGEVIKCYREWKISGDNEWLCRHSESIFKMLEFAWSEENKDMWDRNKDGVLEGRQHHTLDMELFGPTAWLQGFYLLALSLGAQMAEALGDYDRAKTYREIYARGREFTNNELFTGEYFSSKIDIKDKSVIDKFGAEEYWNAEDGEIKYQIDGGSIIDQMLGDFHANILGAPEIFDKEKKLTALKSMYKYNYKPTMREVANMWRNFAVNDESGTIICAYPEGVRKPAIPIPYCEETMTGFEYALAALMISEGMIGEGERLVQAVRDRYDGKARNPYNEIECGSNYARSMSSFALLPIYSGFSFDMTRRFIGFSPIGGVGEFLWSVGDSWGTVSISERKASLLVYGNPLKLSSFGLPSGKSCSRVECDGAPVEFEENGGVVYFSDGVEIKGVIELYF